MPLFHSTGGQPPQIFAKDRDRVITYTLSTAAAKRLRETGVRHGRSVPGCVLASLIRSGDAHSPRTADAAGQQVIFEDDSAAHLPRCELTGAATDLHLVVYGEPLTLFLRQPGAPLDDNRCWQLAPRRSSDHPMSTSGWSPPARTARPENLRASRAVTRRST